jgi:hypothetical protein
MSELWHFTAYYLDSCCAFHFGDCQAELDGVVVYGNVHYCLLSLHLSETRIC